MYTAIKSLQLSLFWFSVICSDPSHVKNASGP